MTGDSYRNFLRDIQDCSDKRLKEVYGVVMDEMEKRSWEKYKVNETVEALSEFDTYYELA